MAIFKGYLSELGKRENREKGTERVNLLCLNVL